MKEIKYQEKKGGLVHVSQDKKSLTSSLLPKRRE
jgi:hypothetical protein